MSTLSETMNRLKKDGYTEDFNLQENCLNCQGAAFQLFPGDFVVDKHYRFEGPSDPADSAVLYAISSDKFNLKGTLVNGYGVSSDAATDALLQALQEKGR